MFKQDRLEKEAKVLLISLSVAIVMVIIAVIGLGLIVQSFMISQEKIIRSQQKIINVQVYETIILQEKVVELEERNKELFRKIEEIMKRFEEWDMIKMEVTAYAPLDPRAIRGMCFSGNRTVTASGEQVIPGVTVAAGPELPFGTIIYVENLGQRIVQDRGGAIGRGHLDIAVETREEALAFGRRELRIFIQRE